MRIKYFGISSDFPIYKQKGIMFFNVAMRIYFLFLLVLSAIMFFAKGLMIIPISFLLGLPIIAFSLFLNSKGKVNFSALLIAIIFPIYFITLSIISKLNGEGTEFFFYIFPRFGIIVITLISFIVLRFSNLKKAFVGILIGVLTFLLFDEIHKLFNLSIYHVHFELSDLKYVIYIIGALFLLFILISTFLQKINLQYENLVVSQKEKIEKTHKQISESIDYAQRLQQSLLPEKEILGKYLDDFFVLFEPKDKVSGDFYWWTHTNNHTIIPAADCTGHGVPGAFMSMLGMSLLREIVQKEQIINSGEILNKLRAEVIKALKQKGNSGENKDGMDMSIVSINHQTNIIQYSGAHNSMYVVTNNKRKFEDFVSDKALSGFYEIRSDKMPIAIYDKMYDFTTHDIQLEKGDKLYLFSDGYADQFGGPKGKKFKYKAFKKLIFINADKAFSEQKIILHSTFNKWKGEAEQIDDMLILGLKI